MYQYTNPGEVYGDMPPPNDERATLRHVARNANGSRSYPEDAGSDESTLRLIMSFICASVIKDDITKVMGH
jgi:hypothetical protein